MESVQGTTKNSSNQIVNKGPETTEGTPSVTANSGFDTTLKAFMTPDGANKVSEEDLFSALVQERIKKAKGDEALQEFQQMLASSKQSMAKGDGYIPVEDATKAALVQFQAAGKLTTEEADKLYSEAFAGAQLDGNEGALFDGRGGANDPTIAVATLEQALMGSRVKMEKFDAGTETAPLRSMLEASTGKSTASAGASDGFLFKPQAEKDGKLVILLPPKLSGLVASVRLMGPNGEEIETGRYSGNGNGGREHFRFSRAGGEYPDGLTVEVKLTTNDVVRYVINETSIRSDAANGNSSSPSTTPSTSPDIDVTDDDDDDDSTGNEATIPL